MFRPEPEYTCCKLVFNYVLTTLFTASYAIICIIFYRIFTMPCTTIVFLSLQQWILGCAIAYSTLIFLHLTLFGIRNKILAVLYYSYVYFLNLPFCISWSIVGSVVLFRDSPVCQDILSPLWSLALSCLIFQWVSLGFIAWEIITKFRNRKD